LSQHSECLFINSGLPHCCQKRPCSRKGYRSRNWLTWRIWSVTLSLCSLRFRPREECRGSASRGRSKRRLAPTLCLLCIAMNVQWLWVRST